MASYSDLIQAVETCTFKTASDERRRELLAASMDSAMKICELAFTELRKGARTIYPDHDLMKEENLAEMAFMRDNPLWTSS